MCDLETSRMGAPYIYDISSLRVKLWNMERVAVHRHAGDIVEMWDFRLLPQGVTYPEI